MSANLRSLVACLPHTALHALVSEETGRLKAVMLQLVQLVDAFQDLLRDQQGGDASDEANREWQARVEVLMIHAEYVMAGKAQMPSEDSVPERDNVVKLTERLKQVSAACQEEEVASSSGSPARVIDFRDHISDLPLQ